MDGVRNIDDCELSGKEYSGDQCKIGVIIDGEYWFIKCLSRPLLEYIGSHIYAILGYPVQDTMLAEYHGELVVVCKDFCNGDVVVTVRDIVDKYRKDLIAQFGDVFRPYVHSHGRTILEPLLCHFEFNPELKDVSGLRRRFWDMIIVDILMDSGDRNCSNYALLRGSGHADYLAPVYDNERAFSRYPFPADDEKYRYLVVNGATCYTLNDDRLIPVQYLLCLDDDVLRESLSYNVPLIGKCLPALCEFFDSLPEIACDAEFKRQCKKFMQDRYESVLLPALHKNGIV